jgi:hypothetical protein
VGIGVDSCDGAGVDELDGSDVVDGGMLVFVLLEPFEEYE